MNPVVWALVDCFIRQEIAECRHMRWWDRRWYNGGQHAHWSEDMRELRVMLGEWRSLWGVL